MPFVGVSFSEHRRPNIYGVRSLITSSTSCDAGHVYDILRTSTAGAVTLKIEVLNSLSLTVQLELFTLPIIYQTMPTAMEQWRAAVGAWNRKLAGMPRSGYYQILWQGRRSQKYRHCKDSDWRLELLLVLLKTICVGKSRFHTQCHGILAGRLSGGGTTLLHYCIVAVASAFSSLVVRCLLIMAGDVELNPGPGK